MASNDIVLMEGATGRSLITFTDANDAPVDLTSATVTFWVKSRSGDPTPLLDFALVVDGAGVGTSTPAGRMALGRPNPANYSGPLIDTAATFGYVTIEFFPGDSEPLVTTSARDFVHQTRATFPDGRVYKSAIHRLTVQDSIFED